MPEHGAVAFRPREPIEGRTAFVSAAAEMGTLHHLSNRVEEPGSPIERFRSFDGLTIADLTQRDVWRADECLASICTSAAAVMTPR